MAVAASCVAPYRLDSYQHSTISSTSPHNTFEFTSINTILYHHMQMKLSSKGPMTMTISQKQENILKHDNLADLRGMALSQHSNRYSSLKRSDSASYSNAAPYRRLGSQCPIPKRVTSPSNFIIAQSNWSNDCNDVCFSSLFVMFVSFPVN